MIKGEAKVLDTDAIIFPMRFGQDAAIERKTKEPETPSAAEENQVKKIGEDRFARLKKSPRKRSASIL